MVLPGLDKAKHFRGLRDLEHGQSEYMLIFSHRYKKSMQNKTECHNPCDIERIVKQIFPSRLHTHTHTQYTVSRNNSFEIG